MTMNDTILELAGVIVLLIILTWIVGCFIVYRLPANNERQLIHGEVSYNMVHVRWCHRAFFEWIMGNRAINLVGQPVFYVSRKDAEQLKPESPFDMKEKETTCRVEMSVRRLLFGGNSVASVVNIEHLNKAPEISK